MRTSRPWDNSLSDDPKVLRIAVRALEEKLRKAKLELTAANEMIRSYRRSLEGQTGASRPSPNHHPSRNLLSERAALMRGLEQRPEVPPPPPPPPRIIRDGQGRVLEQNEAFTNMSDVIMAQMRRRDLMLEKLKIGAIMFALLCVGIGLFFFDAKVIYEWYTNGQ